MRLHRFYVHDMHNKWGAIELTQDLWIHDERLLNQWLRVLRFQVDDEVVLFNEQTERQYRITQLGNDGVHVQLVTERERQTPTREVYLFWSMLKKDKNEWVVQKATELGISHFVPLLTERTEKTGFDEDRAKDIAIEAAEQCGRADIPAIREPIGLEAALTEFKDKLQLYIAEQGGEGLVGAVTDDQRPYGVFIGPEGGWSEAEKALFITNQVAHLGLGQFTLRAETACLAAATILCR